MVDKTARPPRADVTRQASRQGIRRLTGTCAPAFLVAALPILLVLALLGWARRPAWQASLGGLILALVIAVAGWHFPLALAVDSVAAGAVFALWPVMWIVFAAIPLYNVAQRSGRFEAFRVWMIDNLPNGRRIVLVVIGFSFGALLEGISGFGTPIAITSSLLILLGFPTLEALTFTLIFNSTPRRSRSARSPRWSGSSCRSSAVLRILVTIT